MDNVRICILVIEILQCSGLLMNLPAPVNPSISSINFDHLLTWEAGPGSPNETRFTVLVCSLKHRKWKTVQNCTLVDFPLRCNLTEEFSNPEDIYYINVSAHLGNQTSAPVSCPAFQPIKDTLPEPPLLKVSHCNPSLCVQLQPPSPRLFSVYNSPLYGFQYMLHVTVNGEHEFSRMAKGLSDVVLEHLPKGQNYCVSVSIVERNATKRPAVCTFMNMEVYNLDAPILATLSLLILLFGTCFVLLWVSGFLCLKTHLPSILSSLQRPYAVLLMHWSSDGSLTSISVEPRTDKVVHEEINKGMEGEEEDAQVVYEGRQGHVPSGEEASEMGSFPPSSSPVWNRSPCTDTGYHVTEKHTTPVDFQEASCSTAPSEVVLPPPCGTRFGWKPKVAKATGQGMDTCLIQPESDMRELRQKHTSPFRNAHGLGQEGEGKVNVDLSSLTLGGRSGEEVMFAQEMRTGHLGNNVHVKPGELSSPHRAAETALNSQPTSSLNSSNASGAEEEEEEEDFSGYLQRTTRN